MTSPDASREQADPASANPCQDGPTERLNITDISYGGDGVVRREGRFIFVPHTLPGDIVEARVGEFRRGRAWAEVIRFVRRPDRAVQPDCVHYNECSGCALRHISRADERAWKLNEASDILQKYGPGFAGHVEWVGLDPRLFFRRRGRFSVTRQPTPKIGLRSTALGGDLTHIPDCPAQVPEFARFMGIVAEHLQLHDLPLDAVQLHLGHDTHLLVLEAPFNAKFTRVLLQALEAEAVHLVWREGDNYYDQHGSLTEPTVALEHVPGVKVRAPLGSWTHTHHTMPAVQAAWVKRQLLPPGMGRVLETCSGVGTLSVQLIEAGYEVTCVDLDHRALAAIKSGLEPHSALRSRALFRAGKAGTVIRKLRQERQVYAQAIVNPMRRPLGAELDGLHPLGVRRIVYLGPSPVSAARDFSRLSQAGYLLSAVAVMDLHPASAQFMLAGVLEQATD